MNMTTLRLWSKVFLCTLFMGAYMGLDSGCNKTSGAGGDLTMMGNPWTPVPANDKEVCDIGEHITICETAVVCGGLGCRLGACVTRIDLFCWELCILAGNYTGQTFCEQDVRYHVADRIYIEGDEPIPIGGSTLDTTCRQYVDLSAWNAGSAMNPGRVLEFHHAPDKEWVDPHASFRKFRGSPKRLPIQIEDPPNPQACSACGQQNCPDAVNNCTDSQCTCVATCLGLNNDDWTLCLPKCPCTDATCTTTVWGTLSANLSALVTCATEQCPAECGVPGQGPPDSVAYVDAPSSMCPGGAGGGGTTTNPFCPRSVPSGVGCTVDCMCASGVCTNLVCD